jgi:NAD-dependent dihydropyrimidine dehydrogenase PreA subunit
MAYVIGPDCVLCGICEEHCPSLAIKFENEKFYIEKSECISCGSCAEVCLIGAITEEQ